MLLSDFDYNLPEANIAKQPPKVRGTSRLLALDRQTGKITDSLYKNHPDFLREGDLLIINDTRVMQSRLFCHLPDGRKRELIILEKHQKQSNDHVMYRGKLHQGDILTVNNHPEYQIEIVQILGNGIATAKGNAPFDEITEKAGLVPLPPYLHRDATSEDVKRYQTVWAKHMGSAAAPTASLNMTKETLARIKEKGALVKNITLHVGLGTFLPIRSETVEDHHMHSEWFYIPKDTVEAIKQTKTSNHRVIALGTTVARTLEYYGKTQKTTGEDDIFIYPGFEFKVIDALITNFHAPKSTVLMLTAAFAGWDKLKPAYKHAVDSDYKLLSYGDSMFIY